MPECMQLDSGGTSEGLFCRLFCNIESYNIKPYMCAHIWPLKPLIVKVISVVQKIMCHGLACKLHIRFLISIPFKSSSYSVSENAASQVSLVGTILTDFA